MIELVDNRGAPSRAANMARVVAARVVEPKRRGALFRFDIAVRDSSGRILPLQLPAADVLSQRSLRREIFERVGVLIGKESRSAWIERLRAMVSTHGVDWPGGAEDER